MGWAEVIYFIRGVDSFHITPEFYPANTKEGIPVSELLRLGILPLGTKRRLRWLKSRQYLNVGALNVKRPGLHSEIRQLAMSVLGESYGGYRLYRLASPEYFEVMTQVYGRSPSEVKTALELHDHAKK